MKPISSPLSKPNSHYDAVVIGTGYGGGVSASRLARAGQSVCVLERGKEFLPPDFPNDLESVQPEIQINTRHGAALGSETGLYNLHMNDEMNVLVGCGLGGTSLINANVALEVTDESFDQNHWPKRYREKGFLKKHYAMARHMLGSNPYPRDDLNKLKALEQSGRDMGVEFYKPDINVTFESQINPFGVEQIACNNCGDCCSGCNNLAKNTTQMNYLPDARNHGASFFCEAKVMKLEKQGAKWLVHLDDMSDETVTRRQVTADLVVVAAGTLGSTELLLRSQSDTLRFSDHLGEHFSGNGDVLAFGYDSYWKGSDRAPDPINGVGVGSNTIPWDKYPGPCITGIIDNRYSGGKQENARVIEEGVIPGAFASLLAPLFFFANAQSGNFLQYGQAQANARLKSAEGFGKSLLNGSPDLTRAAYVDMVARTQTYLVMSQDSAEGVMTLDDHNNVQIKWPGAGKSRNIVADNNAVKDANAGAQGQFIPNIITSDGFGNQLISVHPLGGCAMGDSVSEGVVSPDCKVFDPDSSGGYHEGLYVMDGSVIPGAAGVNPLLTITAISEYAMETMAKEQGWTVNSMMKLSKPLPFDPFKIFKQMWRIVMLLVHAARDLLFGFAGWLFDKIIESKLEYFAPSFAFTETMAGFATTRFKEEDLPSAESIANTYKVAAERGKAEQTLLHYKLTLQTDNIIRFIKDREQKVTGKVWFDNKELKVTEGVFKLFVTDPDVVETWNMLYSLQLQDGAGNQYCLEGTKYLHQSEGSSWWTDVTTLYVDIYQGTESTGKPYAKGVITLNLSDAAVQASTVDMNLPERSFIRFATWIYPKAKSLLLKLYMMKFATDCAETVFQSYGGLLADLENFPGSELEELKKHGLFRPTSLPTPKTYCLTTEDGFQIKLYRYQHNDGGDYEQVVLAPGFSVAANSFSTLTVDENLVEHLFSESGGTAYDVWLLAYRASPDSSRDTQINYTIDDIARYDWPEAVKKILAETGGKPISAVAHCVGSMSLLMALLNGMQGIKSVISSQLTVHPVTNWLNFLKSDLDVVSVLEDGIKGFPDMSEQVSLRSHALESDESAAVDVLCWEVPVPEGEACKNPVCRRVFSIFGPSYTHTQLNHLTHVSVGNWFDKIATRPFEQIEKIVEKEYVVNADGQDVYLKNVKNLDLPITFLAGGRNQIFLPETSMRTYEWLKAHNKSQTYTRRVFEEYAHMDFFIGKNAHKHIFPYIKEQLGAQS